MRPRFTLLQKILTTLFVVLELSVIACDIVRLFVLEVEKNRYYYSVNLGLCVVLLPVFLLRIFCPKVCVSSEETEKPEQLVPLVSASRTYMCFIAVDISAIFAFVMFAAKYFENPGLWLILVGVVIFIVGSVKYVLDSGRLGIIEFDDENPDPDADKKQLEEQEESEIPEDGQPEEQKAGESSEDGQPEKQETDENADNTEIRA